MGYVMKVSIPRKTIYRLSVYHHCLGQLTPDAGGRISSDALARVAGVKPTQLRKDLAHFGHLGKRGLGYEVETLREKLAEVLGTSKLQPVILIGAGNLGSALLRYQGFAREGFEIVAAFDSDPEKRRKCNNGVVVYDLDELPRIIRETGARMAILSVPSEVAQQVTNTLVQSGIKAILNFAPIILQVPPNVMVNNVNLAVELENLSYFVQ